MLREEENRVKKACYKKVFRLSAIIADSLKTFLFVYLTVKSYKSLRLRLENFCR